MNKDELIQVLEEENARRIELIEQQGKELNRRNDLINKLNKELDYYRQAEEQGLIHKAPVPNGTIIYHITDKDFMDFEKVIRSESYIHGYTEYSIGDINKDWFLTREEAEAALKGGTS
ncbi:MAG: hypothetical protein K0S76_450 [Herbinix sp.]|jgi:hypothetical protein|nr:hypothetical protein [Herbinix sp.]